MPLYLFHTGNCNWFHHSTTLFGSISHGSEKIFYNVFSTNDNSTPSMISFEDYWITIMPSGQFINFHIIFRSNKTCDLRRNCCYKGHHRTVPPRAFHDTGI